MPGRVPPALRSRDRPIDHGTLITIILPIAFYVGFNHTHASPRPLAAGPALAAVVPLTSSRSAYLGAAVGLLVCFDRVEGPAAAGARGRRHRRRGDSVVTPNLLDRSSACSPAHRNDPSIASRTDGYYLAEEFLLRNRFGRGSALPAHLPHLRRRIPAAPRHGRSSRHIAFIALGAGVRVGAASAPLASVTRFAVTRAGAGRCDRDRLRLPVHFRRLHFPDDDGTLFLVLGLALPATDRSTSRYSARLP